MKRNGIIDLLRGMSIFVVLVHHYDNLYPLHKSVFADFIPIKFLRLFSGNGNYGVTIFFVISGFLITSHSLSRFKELKNFDLRAFYIMRAARIFPNILLMLAIVLILAYSGIEIFANNPDSAPIGITILSGPDFLAQPAHARIWIFQLLLKHSLVAFSRRGFLFSISTSLPLIKKKGFDSFELVKPDRIWPNLQIVACQ